MSKQSKVDADLDKILDRLLSFSPALSDRQCKDCKRRHLTGTQVREEAKEQLLAWRDKRVNKSLLNLEKRIASDHRLQGYTQTHTVVGMIHDEVV